MNIDKLIESVLQESNMTPDRAILDIVKKRLGINTLTPRGSDSLDFHEVSVVNLMKTLVDVFQLGFSSGHKEGRM